MKALTHEEKIELMRKYHKKIRTGFNFHIKGEIPSRIIDNALEKFAFGMDRTTVIGFYDTSLKKNGRSGYIFTDEKVYYLETLEKPKKLWYSDIESTEIFDGEKKDSDRGLRFHLTDGESIEWRSCLINKTPLTGFFSELTENDKQVRSEKNALIEARVRALYECEPSDEVSALSKYFETGEKCIEACFDEDGEFILLNDGRPGIIEVPRDMYDDAVKSLRYMIISGRTGAFSDADKAESLVRRGLFTYEQAKNIALSDKVWDISYDEETGGVETSCPMGLSALTALALCFWDDDTAAFSAGKREEAPKDAFDADDASKSVAKSDAARAALGLSDEMISILGMGASAAISGTLGGEGTGSGASFVKNAAEALKSDLLSTALVFSLIGTFDVVNIARGRISKGQFLRNIANTGAAAAGGAAGMMGGAAVGTAILPGAGTVIGGIIGSLAAGGAAGKAADLVTGALLEDDAKDMLNIIEQVFLKLASEHLLCKKEAEKAADGLREKLGGGVLKDMFAAPNRRGFASELILPEIEEEVFKRKRIELR